MFEPAYFLYRSAFTDSTRYVAHQPELETYVHTVGSTYMHVVYKHTPLICTTCV